MQSHFFMKTFDELTLLPFVIMNLQRSDERISSEYESVLNFIHANSA